MLVKLLAMLVQGKLLDKHVNVRLIIAAAGINRINYPGNHCVVVSI